MSIYDDIKKLREEGKIQKPTIKLKEKLNSPFCEKCGRPKEYPGVALCKDCYYKSLGMVKCHKCGTWFYPYAEYHWYCNNCFFQ